MGYLIRVLPSGPRPWKLQFVEYVGSSGQRIRDIPRREYSRLGFRQEMSIEEARARKDQINDVDHLRRVEAKRIAIARRIEEQDTALNAFLNPRDVEEFEETVLFARAGNTKLPSIWRAARITLAELRIPPQEWSFRKASFYTRFIRAQWSHSWTEKVIMVINQWGEFQAMKHGFYFKALEFPRGEYEHRISDAFFDKMPEGRASKPLTPEMLKAVWGRIRDDWYNWFFLTVWLGLRPLEVDRLKLPSGPRTWWIGEARTTDGNEVPCLFIYQKKLIKLPPDKRVKKIPVICKEQITALELIREQNFQRPSAGRHMRAYFPPGVHLYAGRKGFSALMKSLGQDQINYSRWLGHRTVQRTERDYEDQLLVEVAPVRRRRP